MKNEEQFDIRATAIAWGFGIAVLVGFFTGLIMNDYGRWELAKEIGKSNAIAQTDYIGLAICADRVRDERFLNKGQKDYCADIIENTLVHAGFEHLVKKD